MNCQTYTKDSEENLDQKLLDQKLVEICYRMKSFIDKFIYANYPQTKFTSEIKHTGFLREHSYKSEYFFDSAIYKKCCLTITLCKKNISDNKSPKYNIMCSLVCNNLTEDDENENEFVDEFTTSIYNSCNCYEELTDDILPEHYELIEKYVKLANKTVSEEMVVL